MLEFLRSILCVDCGRAVFGSIGMQKTLRKVELPVTFILEYCELEQ